MLMTFEGFTLNAIVQDTIEVVGGPLADGRLGSQASRESAPAMPALVVRPGSLESNGCQTAEVQPAHGLRVRVGSTR